MELKAKAIACVLLCVMLCYFCMVPFAEGAAMQLTWGTPMNINQYVVVGGSDEIPTGKWAYVFQEQGAVSKDVPKADWERMLSGDLSQLANQIETDIPGSKAVWLKVSWTEALYDTSFGTPQYVVGGLRVEAMVQNKNANQTGLEIVAVIMALALLAVVVTLCFTGSWVTWKVMDATTALGPGVTVIVGLLIIVGIGFLLFTFLGGKAEYKGGKRKSLTIGKSK